MQCAAAPTSRRGRLAARGPSHRRQAPYRDRRARASGAAAREPHVRPHHRAVAPSRDAPRSGASARGCRPRAPDRRPRRAATAEHAAGRPASFLSSASARRRLISSSVRIQVRRPHRGAAAGQRLARAQQRGEPAWQGVGRGLRRDRSGASLRVQRPFSSGAAAAFASCRERLDASGDGRQERGMELIHGTPPVVLGCEGSAGDANAKARSVRCARGTCQYLSATKQRAALGRVLSQRPSAACSIRSQDRRSCARKAVLGC